MAENEEFGASEAAAYLGVTTTRLNEIRRTRENFGHLVAGRYWVYTKSELDEFKAQRQARPKGGRPKSGSVIPSPVIAV